MSREICRTLQRAVLNDYYTASVKSEVTLDTLITPVIAELLSLAMGTGKRLKYITKEFPILIEGRNNFMSSKADYLLSDDKYIYFVELKTTTGSYNDKQYEIYRNVPGDTFYEYCERLMRLLEAKYYNKSDFDKEIQGDCLREKLDCLVEKILKEKFDENIKLQKIRDEIKALFGKNDLKKARRIREKMEEKLRSKMKKGSISGTKKFIMQVFQMCVSDEEFPKNKEIKVIYLVPKRTNNMNRKPKSDDCVNEAIEFYTFEDIVKKYDMIKNKLSGSCPKGESAGAGNSSGDQGDCAQSAMVGNNEYLDWLIKDIIRPLFC